MSPDTILGDRDIAEAVQENPTADVGPGAHLSSLWQLRLIGGRTNIDFSRIQKRGSPMRRRELLSAILSGLAGMLPFQSRASAPKRPSTRELQDQLATMAADRDYLVQRGEELFSHLQCLACTISREDQHQTQILSLVSEMRAPLAVIDMTTELILSSDQNDFSDELRFKLGASARSCRNLAQLINQVFILARSRREAISGHSW